MVEKLLKDNTPGSTHSITHKFRGSAGGSMYIVVSVDEFCVPNGIFIQVASSGSTVHNLANAMARVISIAIQNDKATALQIVQTLEDVKSEVVWISDELGKADSIPEAVSLVLLKHIEYEEKIEEMHTEDGDD